MTCRVGGKRVALRSGLARACARSTFRAPHTKGGSSARPYGSRPVRGRTPVDGRNHEGVLALRAASSDVASDVSTASILEDLKNAAMNLHTKDQSASGGQEAPKKRPEFVPTKEGYLRYLIDSRVVFSTLEDIVRDNETLSKLKDNGLERTSALDKDIAFLSEMDVQPAGYEGESSPGTEYARYLKALSEDNLPGFICHYYNTYFAHTAGGRMIGKAVSNKILDGAKLDFYHAYPKSVSKLMTPVKESLEDIAVDWSEEERKSCVNETGKAFKYAGQVMRQITSK